jgi:hypothetical protein
MMTRRQAAIVLFAALLLVALLACSTLTMSNAEITNQVHESAVVPAMTALP